LQAAISTICEVQEQLGVQDVSLLNFVVSDGSTMIATRFVRPEGEAAATLYYAEGASFDRQQQQPQPQQQPHTQPQPQQPRQTAAQGSSSANGSQQQHPSHCTNSNGLQPAPDDGSSDTHGSGHSSEDEQNVAALKGASGQAPGNGCNVCGANNLVGSSVLCEASYNISYSERGPNMAFVASEPITGSTTDWVS
jgi:hypothetical protein